jgi:hypothetical protein
MSSIYGTSVAIASNRKLFLSNTCSKYGATVNAGKEKHPGQKTGVLMVSRNIRKECLGAPQNAEMGGIEKPV